jgi:hypothetical protein
MDIRGLASIGRTVLAEGREDGWLLGVAGQSEPAQLRIVPSRGALPLRASCRMGDGAWPDSRGSVCLPSLRQPFVRQGGSLVSRECEGELRGCSKQGAVDAYLSSESSERRADRYGSFDGRTGARDQEAVCEWRSTSEPWPRVRRGSFNDSRDHQWSHLAAHHLTYDQWKALLSPPDVVIGTAGQAV